MCVYVWSRVCVCVHVYLYIHVCESLFAFSSHIHPILNTTHPTLSFHLFIYVLVLFLFFYLLCYITHSALLYICQHIA